MKTRILIIMLIPTLFLSCEKKQESSNLSGLTFTLFQDPGPSSTLKLGDNVVNYSEIIGYDSTKHTFLLNDHAKERILQHATSSFAVALDGSIVYMANFIPGYSSTSCVACIRIEPYSLHNKYKVELGYPGVSNLFTGIDSRNDDRIIKCLAKDNKIITITDK